MTFRETISAYSLEIPAKHLFFLPSILTNSFVLSGMVFHFHLVRSFRGHKLCRRLIIGHAVDLRAGCDSMQRACVCEREMHASMFNWVCSRGSNLSPSHRVLQQWLIQDQGRDGQGLHTQTHSSSPTHTHTSYTYSNSHSTKPFTKLRLI